MELKIKDFQNAQKENIITKEQVEQLVDFFNLKASKNELKAKFSITNFLYYFGALLVILAMGWYMGNVWFLYGEKTLLATCLIYILCFTLVGNYLWKKDLKIPGGLLFAIAVSTVPLTTYVFEKIIGLWPLSDPGNYAGFHIWIRGNWIYMEIMTILAGIAYIKFRKFPFLTAPIAFAAWYLSMDLTPIISLRYVEPSWDERKLVSLIFGIILIVIAYFYDKKTEGDYSFWFYLFGSIAFWCGLTAIIIQINEFYFFIYGLVNLLMMLLSVLLQRKVFMVFGTLGVLGYIGHLGYDLFSNSIAFPLVLSAIGIATIFLGILYQKNVEKIELYIEGLLPENITKHLPKYRH